MTTTHRTSAFALRGFLTVASVLLAAEVIASCSSSDSSNGISHEAACNALAGQCGGACTVATQRIDCPVGTYCGGDGKCTADCVQGEVSCPSGYACGTDGRCIGTGGSGGNGSIAIGGDGCAPIEVPFGGGTPTVLLLVDRSGSMDDAFGNGTRWSVLHDALMNQNDGVVWSLQSQVRFGLSLYTGGDPCPDLINVPIALNNYDPIEAEYGSAGPGGDTPTAEAIAAASAILSAFNEPGPKYILLVTDGLPDTCADPDAHDAQSQAGSVAAAQAAYNDGNLLIPMGLSDDIATQGAGPGHLQDLANAGAGLPIGGSTKAPYYEASSDPAELSAQFGTIVGGIRTCLFDLRATVDPVKASQGVVTLDNDVLGFEDPNGWRLSTPEQIEILGDACDKILTSASRLSIVFPCDSDAVEIR